MKTKVMVFLAISAAITLSFTFTVSHKVEKPATKAQTSQTDQEPAGGFVSSDDKF
jgi:hypothetical protein